MENEDISCFPGQTEFSVFLEQIALLFQVPYVTLLIGDKRLCYPTPEALPGFIGELEAQVQARQVLLVLGPEAFSARAPLRFYAGLPVGKRGVLAIADSRPRTLSKQARRLLRAMGTLVEGLEKHVEQKQRYERLLRAKAYLLERIATGKPLHEVLDGIVRWVETESKNGVIASILLVQEGRFYHGAAPSLPPGYRQAIDGQAIGLNPGSYSTATYECAPTIVEDLATDPRGEPYRGLALTYGLRACWQVPILAPDQTVLGIFALYYHQPGRPDAQEQELVALATHLAAIALERERQRQALQAREHQLEAVLEQAADAIVLLDAAQRIVLFNRAAERLFGYTAEAVLGMSVDVLLPGLAQESLGGKVPVQTEAIRNGGECFPVELSCTVMAQPFEMYVLIVRDLTERLRYEAELVRAREEAETMSRLKSALLTNLTHEIRTPLTTIIGFADLLAEESNADSSFQEFARLIAEGGRRLLHTLSEVLDLAQLEAREITLRPCKLRLLPHLRPLLATYRARAEQKGLKLRVQLKPHLEVWADPVLLERVLEEVLDNAVKFTATGSVTVSFHQADSRFAIIVEDTGIGMSAETLQHVFDEFWQASSGINRTHEGLGLGLTIARRFVELMGGEIEVHSVPGKGSRFVIWLPAISRHLSEKAA